MEKSGAPYFVAFHSPSSSSWKALRSSFSQFTTSVVIRHRDRGLGSSVAPGRDRAEPSNSAFIPRPTGALIVRWVGADDAGTLISAALAVPDDQFTEAVGDLPHDGGKLLMFDSAAR